ncbi:GbsR/MarR family transcriptional regulator [Hydromonas duriensis]|nr:GbsR/MarR family transcriptional regulator [Hydromonas duriensis]
MSLPPISQKFVSHFGEMGSHWGINRTVGQIYALLYIAEEPLPAERISELLGFSRSNVSIGLKELNSWRLIKMTHKVGDRREYFSSLSDIWEIFRTVAAERHRREIQPTATVVREALLETPSNAAEVHAQEQIRKMSDLFELANSWFDELQDMSIEEMARLMKLGMQVKGVLDITDKLSFKNVRASKKSKSTSE